jgi:hypothetical protein
MAGRSVSGHVEAMKANLPAKTGRTFEQWVALARKGPGEVKGLVAWLKEEHGLGTVTATMIAHEVHGGHMRDREEPEALLESHFAGDKAPLREVYDALIRAAHKANAEISVHPAMTYITLKRGTQFGVVKVARTRIDLGLILPGTEPEGRLERASHLGNDRVTHQLTLATKKDVDAEVVRWLKVASERKAPSKAPARSPKGR